MQNNKALNLRNTSISIALTLPIFLSLICSEKLIYTTLTSFFLFAFATIGLLLLSSILIFKNRNLVNSLFNWPLLIYTIMLGYVILWPTVSGSPNGNLKEQLLLLSFLLGVASVILIKAIDNQFTQIFRIVFLFGLYESLVCISQSLELIQSQSQWFSITGTFPNPNITAMFLTLCLPSSRVVIKATKEKNRRIYIAIGYVIITIAIIMLKCRTAYIGIGVMTIVFLFFSPNVKKYIQANRYKTILVIIACVIGITLVSNKTYQIKKDSADGRLLIWKITLAMIIEKPLMGYGYGMFEKEYNQHQSHYFASEATNAQEKANANHVNMGYNEYLEIATEGGLIGLFLFLGFIVSLVITYIKVPSNHVVQTAITGIAIWLAMSMTNFTIQAVPVMAVFMLNAAIVISYIPQRAVSPKNNVLGYLSGITLIILSILIFQNMNTRYIAFVVQKESLLLIEKNKTDKAIVRLETITKDLSDCESYYNLGLSAYLRNGDYENAYDTFQKGQQFTSNHQFYMNGGIACEMLNRDQEAEQAYIFVSNMIPNHLASKYRLMLLLAKQGKKREAIEMAVIIYKTETKSSSEQTKYYKEVANQFLTNK